MTRSTVQMIIRIILRLYPLSFNLCRSCCHMILRLDDGSYFNFLISKKLLQNGLEIWYGQTKRIFYLEGKLHAHNCWIWEPENPRSILQAPLHSTKVMVWLKSDFLCSASFILCPYFFEELSARDPPTYAIIGQPYASLLENKIFPDCNYVLTFYVQHGAPPHSCHCIIYRYLSYYEYQLNI